jgi:hypothetical protein
MIHYTQRIETLMRDVVSRVEALADIDVSLVLVFGRPGRADADGPFATCHCLTLPTSAPGYYFWRDRATGTLTRRSEWFVTKSPEVRVGPRRIAYLVSVSLPRFVDQPLCGTPKAARYPGGPEWIARLDTIVHELYHIDPGACGLRHAADDDGRTRSHGAAFFDRVAGFVREYLATRPDPAVYDFLQHDFDGLVARFGGVVATTFRNYPSYPQRYEVVLDTQPEAPDVRVVPVKRPSQPALYTEADLCVREFAREGTRRLRAAAALAA